MTLPNSRSHNGDESVYMLRSLSSSERKRAFGPLDTPEQARSSLLTMSTSSAPPNGLFASSRLEQSSRSSCLNILVIASLFIKERVVFTLLGSFSRGWVFWHVLPATLTIRASSHVPARTVRVDKACPRPYSLESEKSMDSPKRCVSSSSNITFNGDANLRGRHPWYSRISFY